MLGVKKLGVGMGVRVMSVVAVTSPGVGDTRKQKAGVLSNEGKISVLVSRQERYLNV